MDVGTCGCMMGPARRRAFRQQSKREGIMRIMVKFAFPVETGNAAIRTGKLEKVFQQIVEDLKPEAAYFHPEGGERAGFFVINMDDSSQIALTAERFFFGLNARIELVP